MKYATCEMHGAVGGIPKRLYIGPKLRETTSGTGRVWVLSVAVWPTMIDPHSKPVYKDGESRSPFHERVLSFPTLDDQVPQYQ